MSKPSGGPTHFKARNLFYLRISPRTVLMCTVLLDQRHVNWMTDETFQRILQVLKPRLLNKLKSETNPLSGPSDASQKKTKMDVHRGTGFQMGYYFRKNTARHAVLLKNKELVYSHLKTQPKRGKHPTSKEDDTPSEDDIPFIKPEPNDDDLDYIPPAASRTSQDLPITIEDDEDGESDLKPRLKVSYDGFSIFGRTLVVVVEPFPALSAYELRLYQANSHSKDHRQLSVLPSSTPRPASAGPSEPLFRSETPAPEDDGFLARSQALIDRTGQTNQHQADDEEDDELPDLDFGSSTHGGLLTEMIKNPNSDRQNSSKHPTQNLTLDQYVVSKK